MKSIRVIIADDHVIMREGVALILDSKPEFEVVGQAADGKRAVELAESLQPDIALLDINMPELDGIAAANLIREACPQTKTLILTMHNDDAIFFDAIQAGASGYVLKGSRPDDLIQALIEVHNGNVYISPPMTRKLVNSYLETANSYPNSQLTLLTERETEVMQLLAQGLTNREVAERLVISPSTVQTHRTHIMEKLDLNNRTELVRYALQNNLLDS
ncbi:MAG: response regulator transcription factor [Ardenticatenaceae bacterium]|nr:response regulator transcription factor [Ardenticatenaceae bacterium]MCB9443896.1 response regulator transcription factor [Ardenticatenaceae bacterium]